MKFEWETLHERILNDASTVTQRSKVFGGWIVNSFKSIAGKNEVSLSESMVFISDPEHKWKITEK